VIDYRFCDSLDAALIQPHSPFDSLIEDFGEFAPKQFEVPRLGPEDVWQIPEIFFKDPTREEKRI
jgi:hypothetical protein